MHFFFWAIPIIASIASAIEIIHPNAHSTLAAGEVTKVKWTHVDEDPKTLSLYLVNFVDWPPSYVKLARDVHTDKDRRKVKIPCDTRPSHGYQINAINGTNIHVIYAQSAEFAITGSHENGECD
ncbi:hypothetical protein FQN57_006800 [Myotisia sp. PD_48]|nr:hypothetical protein FQN57_006800 [Myotisia sp. PD_48]